MARRDRLIRQSIRSRFMVTLHSGETFEGVLIDWDESNLVLADAAQLSAKGDRASVDGHLWLPRPYKYMQAPTVPLPGWNPS